MSQADTVMRVRERLEAYPAGVHRIGGPRFVLDSELPAAVAEVLRCFDGAELFHETLVLLPSRDIVRTGERFHVGTVAGDDLFVDRAGKVWTLEQDTGELLQEGGGFVRWLAGWVDAESECYDEDGEFVEGAFDDAGEPTSEFTVRRERRLLKRDRSAPAPRWRLARALTRLGDVARAREELELLVEQTPAFSWAWYDLGRLSERLSELDAAIDDYQAAAEAQSDYEHNALFWAHAARAAGLAGDEERREALAASALSADPGFGHAQRDAAAASLEDGDLAVARELAALAAALLPRDLVLRDVLARIEAGDVGD